MKFAFSLEPVLKVRKHQETLQKQKLAGELQKQQKIGGLREDVRRRLKGLLESGQVADAARVHTMKRLGSHMEEVHQQIRKLEQDLDQANELVNMERHKLTEVHKSRHLLEKLKEYKMELHRRESERSEQKGMDEIASNMVS